jgi:hypothetical protein
MNNDKKMRFTISTLIFTKKKDEKRKKSENT